MNIQFKITSIPYIINLKKEFSQHNVLNLLNPTFKQFNIFMPNNNVWAINAESTYLKKNNKCIIIFSNNILTIFSKDSKSVKKKWNIIEKDTTQKPMQQLLEFNKLNHLKIYT